MSISTLIPNLAMIRTRLAAPNGPEKPFDPDADLLLEQLPYALSAARQSILDLIVRANALVEHDRPQMQDGIKMLAHTAQQRDPLAFCIDSYFTFARRAQNAVCLYVSKAMRKSVSSSLAKYATAIQAGRIVANNKIDQIVFDYWSGSGKRVRAYRDLSEHHAIISSDIRIIRSESGELLLHLCLANNPEIKSTKQLLFRDPIVHAIPFVLTTFGDLLAFVSTISDALIAEVGSTKFVSVSMVFRGGLSFGGNAVLYGEQVPPIAEVDALIEEKMKGAMPSPSK